MNYEPELGQLIMGQKSQDLECPEYVVAALEYLANFFDKKSISEQNPFRNTGWNWANSIFTVFAYEWDKDIELRYNFKYKDIEISWYKYLGRGMSINRKISELECWKMLQDCINSIICRKKELKETKDALIEKDKLIEKLTNDLDEFEMIRSFEFKSYDLPFTQES